VTTGDDSPPTSIQEVQDQPVALDDVEVVGRRGRALIESELELDAALIGTLGAYDIGEVIQRLKADQVLGEDPVIIVNGRRIADASVFFGFPPDALVRAEVLPPEAATLYGATDPSRRVINLVLQPRFQSQDGRVSLRRPTAGGMTSGAGDLRQSSIVDSRTRQLGFQVTAATALIARNRRQNRGGEPNGDTLTLRSPSESVAFNLTQTGQIGEWSASLKAAARAQETRSVSIDSQPAITRIEERQAVDSRRRSQSLTVTGGLNGDLAGWSVQGSLSGAASWKNQTGLFSSNTRQQSVAAELGLDRPLVEFPAGPWTANLSGRASGTQSITERFGQRRTFSGRAGDLNGNLLIPIARRRAEVRGRLDALGDLSITMGGNLSGTDVTRGGGLNAALAWSPDAKLRANAMWSTATQSRSDTQRFDPEYYGEPIKVFDFVAGVSTDVLPVLGGNPDLRQPIYDRFSVAASAGPFTVWALQASMTYQRASAVDEIGTLPDPTPEVEASFPDRFRRDTDGRLIAIDRRPINFASSFTNTLTTSLGAAYTLGLGTDASRQGVLRLKLNHSWQLANAMILRPELPVMNRLAGDGGGLPRHQVGFLVDFRQGRWGANAAARWQPPYRSRRKSGQNGPDDLLLATFTAVDFRLSYQFESGRSTVPDDSAPNWSRGLQIEVEVANLLDGRPRARLGDGRLAPGFGRDDRDPVGRTFLITLKKRL